jgi:hypothetical protein
MKTEYPVGDWSPSLPELQEVSNKIEVAVDKMLSYPKASYRRLGEVWYDPEREQYICQGIYQENPEYYYHVADFVVQDGVDQVWVKQDFKEADGNNENSYLRDGSAYFSSSGCSTTESIDCRLCATLKWGGSGATRSASIVNNLKSFSNSMTQIGLVRRFS